MSGIFARPRLLVTLCGSFLCGDGVMMGQAVTRGSSAGRGGAAGKDGRACWWWWRCRLVGQYWTLCLSILFGIVFVTVQAGIPQRIKENTVQAGIPQRKQ